ncbi:MAG: hypothetical protein AAGA11_09085 [Pseudomonadota bacterium]
MVRIPNVAAGWCLCAAVAAGMVWIEWRGDPAPAPTTDVDRFDARAARLEQLASATLRQQFEARLHTVQSRTSRAALVKQAERAVAVGDREAMAEAVHELGVLAMARGDLDGADVWLADALAEYDAMGDERGRARVLLDMGRLHMAFRERAQRAAFDYDELLIARWAMANGYRDDARVALEHIVGSSLQLNRYGTAASALSSLFELHLKAGDVAASLDAGQRALELHASAGNLHSAQRMLTALRDHGLDRESVRRAESAMALGLETFERETQKLGLVRDYMQLYHQLTARGDPVGAWRYRRQAEELRTSTSRRAMYRRQPDVLVELYRSNRSIDRASDVLRDAESAFERLGMVEEMLQSAALQQDIR